MKKLFNKVINFFKFLWELVKSMGTVKGLIALFISFSIYVGWAIALLVIGVITSNGYLISLGTGVILFWLGPFTPMWLLIITTAVFIQRVMLRDKKAKLKEEILKLLQEEN